MPGQQGVHGTGLDDWSARRRAVKGSKEQGQEHWVGGWGGCASEVADSQHDNIRPHVTRCGSCQTQSPAAGPGRDALMKDYKFFVSSAILLFVCFLLVHFESFCLLCLMITGITGSLQLTSLQLL